MPSLRIALASLAVLAASLLAAAGETLPERIAAEEVEGRPYADYVRDAAGVLIQHGTDRYGAVHSPILMNILDIASRECPADPLALDEAWRVTRRERRGPAGANLYRDQPTGGTVLFGETRQIGTMAAEGSGGLRRRRETSRRLPCKTESSQ